MGHRRHDTRRAKSLRCYTIAEAADLYAVHRQTVRHWIAGGLPSIDSGRPTLIHGQELNSFHKAKREANKRQCGPGEIFCFGCHKPRPPALGMADYVRLTEKVGTLSATCPVCARLMTQKVNDARLSVFLAKFKVAIRPAPEPISESD